MLESAKNLVIVSVNLVQHEGSPVADKTLDEFFKVLETDKLLRDAISFQHSMVQVARLWTRDGSITEADIDIAIKEKWGVDCYTCLSRHCVSEVPGF